MPEDTSHLFEVPQPPTGGAGPLLSHPSASNDTAESQIAALLTDAQLVTRDQLRLAQRVHAKVKAERSFLSVLVELQYADEKQVRTVLRARRPPIALELVLVELGYLAPHDLKLVLAMAEQHPEMPLHQVIIEHNFVNEFDVLGVLSDLLDIEVGAPDAAALDAQLLRKAPAHLYRTHRFVPFGRNGERVVVAFADPRNVPALEAARKYFGPDLTVAIAGAHSVMAAIERAERESAAATSSTRVTESPAVLAVNQVIMDAIAERASDIHFEPLRDRLRIRFRQDGAMMPYKEIPQELAGSMIGRIKVMAGADIAERRRHQDGRILFETGRGTIDIRVSIYISIHGEKIVMRLLNSRAQVPTIRDIGMSPRMLEFLHGDALDAPSGVVIVTGPTGSGKTTTLYAAVNYLNDAKTSIITAEDPVEYVIEGISQCSINPKINLSYEETLKHIMRQDPDVIVIGEIRDQFSAEVAINAALTGHKVLTTFHTEDSIGGLVRLMNMNIEAFLISSTVISVIAQRLLRRVCKQCAEDHVLTPHELRRMGYAAADAAGLTFKRGRGCPACRHTGYRGRVAVFELLVLNERVRDAIIARKTSFEIRRISTETSGLVTLLEDGIAKAAAGDTTFEEIIRELPRLAAPRPLAELRRMLGVKE